MKKGFTLIELLVVIAIIAILAAILFPVYAQLKEKARQANCQSNLKQLVLAAMTYTDDYDGHFPFYCDNTWTQYWAGLKVTGGLDVEKGLLMPYVKTGQLQACPSFRAKSVGYGTGYGYNWLYIGSNVGNDGDWAHIADTAASLSELNQPSKTVIFADSEVDWGMGGGAQESIAITAPSQQNGCDDIGYRHNDKAVAAFCDGHVASYPKNVLERNSPIVDEFFRRR